MVGCHPCLDLKTNKLNSVTCRGQIIGALTKRNNSHGILIFYVGLLVNNKVCPYYVFTKVYADVFFYRIYNFKSTDNS